MQARLANAWESAEHRQAAAHSNRSGIYLEFASSPGFDLKTTSLEYRPAGVRLLNVRTEFSEEGERTLATVYIPRNKASHFLKKIEQYGSEETIKGNPKNQPLVASIDDIKSALLESFWTDDTSEIPTENPQWVEVWLATDDALRVEEFRQVLQDVGIAERETRSLLIFPERAVILVWANGPQLTRLIDHADVLAELRRAKESASFFVEMENRDQAEWTQDLLDRTTFDNASNVAVCILDSGVNQGHPLLIPVLDPGDCQTVQAHWGLADHERHGTRMAGLAAYGDLQRALEARVAVTVRHKLESVKILPPRAQATPKELWGDMTAQGISHAEINAPFRRRIFCLAVTAMESRDRGRPSSWSAEIDQMSSGALDRTKRLIVVSAGNVREPAEWANYPTSNLTNEIHDPAQSWNALTVGAYTDKTAISHEDYWGYTPVAPGGGLSPYSTTSTTWPARWPIKPDIVLEGGNVAEDGANQPIDVDDLQLVSTWHDITVAHYGRFNATSAATAQASWMTAVIQAQYPDAWPETIRALLVHSATWSQAMKGQFLVGTGKASYRNLLRACGYGTPRLDHALRCLESRLTLVAEKTLSPFTRTPQGRYVTNDLHLFELPWPREALLALGNTEVRMRITLSYFIEPGPGQIGWRDKYRYASHGLRFELNSPGEDVDVFTRRINVAARSEEGGRPDSEGPGQQWTLGQQRNAGSIHSDIWVGTAANLATSNLLAVHPVIGWWRERAYLGKWDRQARYTLVVSIESPIENVDLYTPVMNQIQIPIDIPIEV